MQFYAILAVVFELIGYQRLQQTSEQLSAISRNLSIKSIIGIVRRIANFSVRYFAPGSTSMMYLSWPTMGLGLIVILIGIARGNADLQSIGAMFFLTVFVIYAVAGIALSFLAVSLIVFSIPVIFARFIIVDPICFALRYSALDFAVKLSIVLFGFSGFHFDLLAS